MREEVLFDDDWLFHEGDIDSPCPRDKGPLYTSAKTRRVNQGPGAIDYFDAVDAYDLTEYRAEKWERVTLPHDYVIRGKMDEHNNVALGYFEYNNAWYRKHFVLDKKDYGKRLTLYFEGIATRATVYLNGCELKHNFCGYTSFEVDITDFVDFENENVLAVYVNTQNHESWWYEGGGIYRHVWLKKTDLVSVDTYGLYCAPQKISDGQWSTNVEVSIRNDDFETKKASVICEVVDDGEVIALAECAIDLPMRQTETAKLAIAVKSPKLWDIDSPNLYTIRAKVFADGRQTDEVCDRFGYRSFECKKDGFYLNGKRIKINGVCSHQDFGLTGKAVPDNILRYKVQMAKQMGANGFRCSHYPHPVATMNALDELGFITMSETRWFDSSDEGIEQLKMLVKRDRNHPSVFFWSVGNEERCFTDDMGKRIFRAMYAEIKKLDPTRLITCAVDKPEGCTVFEYCDAIGINYNLNYIDQIHEKFPDKPIYSSECCATQSGKGWYFPYDTAEQRANAYDADTNKWFLGRGKTWKFFSERDWFMGGFQWIAFEHRGEAMWPRICSQSGAIDLFLQKKDAFYHNLSMWSDKPMIHLMPHWNFEGLEGKTIDVRAYTNLDAAELFVNGKSFGKVAVDRYLGARWQVPYERGMIKAVGYAEGEVTAFDCKVTSDKPVALKLELQNNLEPIRANGKDIAVVACYCIDDDGNPVPDCTNEVRFFCDDMGQIVGTGASNTDHEPIALPVRKMWAGVAVCGVRAGQKPGKLKLYAQSSGLKSDVLEIEIK